MVVPSTVFYHNKRRELINRLGGECNHPDCDISDPSKLEFHHHDHKERGKRDGGLQHLYEIEREIEKEDHSVMILCGAKGEDHHHKFDCALAREKSEQGVRSEIPA